jgi:hypothetical protein
MEKSKDTNERRVKRMVFGLGSFFIRVDSRKFVAKVCWVSRYFFFGELGTFWSDLASDQFLGEAFCKAEIMS